MKARLIAELALDGWIHEICQLGDRLVVGARGGVHVVRGDRLEPLLASIEVLEMHGEHVRTPGEIVRLDGGRFSLPSFERGHVSRFLAHAGGVIAGIEDDDHVDAAAVARIDDNGAIVWHAPTPPPGTIGGFVREMRREDGFRVRPKPAWVPEQWNLGYDDLIVSGDLLLAHFAEMPRSGIGICYGIELAMGKVVYTTAPAPYHELAAAPDAGAFLLGVQGYGAFETRLVNRTGTIRTTWPSHGIVLGGDPVRLLEMDNAVPSELHVATLRADGRVDRGARLPGYYTSAVLTAADGSAVFWRDGVLVRVTPDGQRVNRLLETPGRGRPHVRALGGRVPGRILLAWSTSYEADGGWKHEQSLLLIDVADA